MRVKAALYSVYSGVSTYGNSFISRINEPFAGAWQRNMECESRENILAFSAVYSCVSLIANDIAKLRLKLMQLVGGVWIETSSAAFSPVLKKPNRYQTRIQFISQWITSKLLFGNTYILKERDQRRVVTALYVLDPRRVTTLVSSDGGVYYQLQQDDLAGVAGPLPPIPASEIIHDRAVCLFHPLVGVSPIYACGASATQGIRIQTNSERFFSNMSRPSGQLTAPGTIEEATAKRLKEEFEQKFGGANLGRIFVGGDGLKFDSITIPAQDAQLIEQLRWTVEDVARCFHMPLHKLGLGSTTQTSIPALNQDYYNQALQCDIESIELLLDEGLGLTDVQDKTYGVELDLDGLLRMDPISQAEVMDKQRASGFLSPNEGRAKIGLGPVSGGAFPYLQQQNFSLEALAKRDAKEDPFATTPKTPAALPPPAEPADMAPAKAIELAWEEAGDIIAKALEATPLPDA